MFIPTILAHGALGPWDELIFLGVAAIFLTMMGISWIRSRTNNPTIEQTDDTNTTPADENSPDHFPLE
jgi:hypothetical protein